MNSPTNPDVPGRPAFAIANSTNSVAVAICRSNNLFEESGGLIEKAINEVWLSVGVCIHLRQSIEVGGMAQGESDVFERSAVLGHG